MLKNIVVVFILFWLQPAFSEVALESGSDLIGIKSQFRSNASACKLYDNHIRNSKALICLSNLYEVHLIDFPKNKNFTYKTFCPPLPQLAIVYFNIRIEKNDTYMIDDVLICRQKHISYTKKIELYCAPSKNIRCENVYDIEYDIENTTDPSSLSTTLQTKTAENAKYEKLCEGINQECNYWMCRIYQLTALFVTVTILGTFGIYFYFKFKHEKYVRIQAEETNAKQPII